MPTQSPKKPKGSGRSGNEKFPTRVWMIYFIIFALIFGIWTLAPGRENNVKELRVIDVINRVKQGAELEGVIKSDPNWGEGFYIIEGTIKDPIDGAVPDSTAGDGDGLQPLQAGQLFRAEGKLTEDDYEILRETFREERGSTVFLDIVVGLLPFIIIIGLLYFLFVRQLRNAGKGAMSFGKSKAKLLTRDREKVTFKEVAGCDEAKEEVSEIVDFLRDPKKFTRIGGRIPKGVLMVGPPGTGKTLLARAVAGEADVPFFSISGSDFVEMFVGVGAARVRDMFEQGRKSAPCLIFIDEIDAVGRQRGAGLGGGNDEREQTLNSLLVEMDGFEGHEGIIIIAATNRPDVLDNALLRPGRFDRQVTIDLPDVEGRESILKVHAKKIALSKDIDLRRAARNTPGFSGADLANLLNEAALIAARRNIKEVTNLEVDEARDKIAYGRERRRLLDDEDKKITAWHEAGHAIVQAVIDDGTLPVHKVTIIPRGQSLGSTMFLPSKDILNQSRNRLINQMCTAMGGRAAEEIVMEDITSGASGDIRMATKIARKMVCDWGMSDLGPVAYGENQDHVFLGKEIARDQNYSEKTAQAIDQAIHDMVESQHQRALEILKGHRKALDVLAEALLEHETLEGFHVKEIIEHGELKSPVVKPPEPAEEPEPELEEDKPKAKEGKQKGDDLPPEAEPVGNPA
ncbi:MAG: ATP-dependent zinc metalloprotease FtsH [Opitutales bacterium]